MSLMKIQEVDSLPDNLFVVLTSLTNFSVLFSMMVVVLDLNRLQDISSWECVCGDEIRLVQPFHTTR